MVGRGEGWNAIKPNCPHNAQNCLYHMLNVSYEADLRKLPPFHKTNYILSRCWDENESLTHKIWGQSDECL